MSTIQVYKTTKTNSTYSEFEQVKPGQNNSQLCAYDMIGLGWIMEDDYY